MTEATQIAQAMHSIQNKIPIATKDGIVTLKVSITMPLDSSDNVWDSMHAKFNKIVENATGILED